MAFLSCLSFEREDFEATKISSLQYKQNAVVKELNMLTLPSHVKRLTYAHKVD